MEILIVGRCLKIFLWWRGWVFCEEGVQYLFRKVVYPLFFLEGSVPSLPLTCFQNAFKVEVTGNTCHSYNFRCLLSGRSLPLQYFAEV